MTANSGLSSADSGDVQSHSTASHSGLIFEFGKVRVPMAALGCDLNRSMQHLHSSTGEGDVENEATIEDLLQLRTKKPDVGSLAER